MGLPERELAERARCPPETVRRLVELGSLVRRETDGPFVPSDVHLVRLMEAFRAAGNRAEVIARGIGAGELSYENLPFILSEPPPLAQTYDELALEAGRSPDLVRRLMGEFAATRTV